MFVYYSIGLMLCPLADVIAFSVIIGDFGLMLLPLFLNFEADVIALWQME